MDKIRQQQLHSDQQFCDRYTKQKEVSTKQKELTLTMLLRKPFRRYPLF